MCDWQLLRCWAHQTWGDGMHLVEVIIVKSSQSIAMLRHIIRELTQEEIQPAQNISLQP